MQAGFRLKKGGKARQRQMTGVLLHIFSSGRTLIYDRRPCWLYVAGRGKQPYFQDDASKPGCRRSSPSCRWRSAESGFPGWIQTSETPPARVSSGSMDFIVFATTDCMSWPFCEERLWNVPQASILQNVGIQNHYLNDVGICFLSSLSFRLNQRYPPKTLSLLFLF